MVNIVDDTVSRLKGVGLSKSETIALARWYNIHPLDIAKGYLPNAFNTENLIKVLNKLREECNYA